MAQAGGEFSFLPKEVALGLEFTQGTWKLALEEVRFPAGCLRALGTAPGGQCPAFLSTVVLCCRNHHRNPPCHLSSQLPCAEEGAEAPSDPDGRDHNGRWGGRRDVGVQGPHTLFLFTSGPLPTRGSPSAVPFSHLVLEQNPKCCQGPAAVSFPTHFPISRPGTLEFIVPSPGASD